ncbi:flagellar type III secretion system protein FliR [Phyllobacterium salinisoli]|uniref:Flagellar biosynthetic protein FliR n=1 Tax=Phyllobacterium salinisoli TaxID=1899321 RepID=A0A368K5T2_9HYPH|nr:flagellar biosynthetic protein FliR [Phyllobacterium salinisoli]RCS23995.1 flagellar type III secretion system protein FliR [Phyllobacterium salinisoli]
MPLTALSLPLNEMVLTAFLVFARVGACLMVMPGVSSPRIPMSVRLFLALACSLMVVPLLQPRLEPTLANVQSWTMLRLIVTESIVGGLIGILAQIYFWALQFMAGVIAMTIGYSGAPSGAIEESEPQAIIASIITLSALFLFFVTDLHQEVFRALLSSYSVIPVDSGLRPDAALVDVTDAFSSAFTGTLRIAAPFIVFAILVNIAIGLVNKLTPTIPVYFISLPFVLAGGLVLTYFLLPELLTFFVSEAGVHLRSF